MLYFVHQDSLVITEDSVARFTFNDVLTSRGIKHTGRLPRMSGLNGFLCQLSKSKLK